MSKWNLVRWTPAECDTPIDTSGWFWDTGHTPKSPTTLETTYYTSVGRNCQLLLNVGPDNRGLLDQSTLNALSTFGQTIQQTFAINLAAGATASNDSGTANTATHPPALALDASLDTSWQPTGNTGGLVLDLGADKTFDVISVQEDLNVGMRTTSFAVDTWNGSAWTQVAADTTVGHKKLVRLTAQTTTSRVRLRITGARSNAAIASFGLFKRPGSTAPGTLGFIRSGVAGKCIQAEGNSADGGAAVIWDCQNGTAQAWSVAGDGTLQAYGKCLDISGGSTANGGKAIVWTCHGGGNQKWQVSGGALVNPQSGRCLDIPGFNTTNGTQLVIWDCNGGNNQKWILP